MKKVGIVSAVLTLLLVALLSGCLSINAPSARQLMSIGSTAPVLSAIVAKTEAKKDDSVKSSELWLNLNEKMISSHKSMMNTHHQNMLRERETQKSEEAKAQENQDRYVSYDEMLQHHNEMHEGRGGYYCYNHGLYTDAESFNNNSTYDDNYSGGHHRNNYNSSRRSSCCY